LNFEPALGLEPPQGVERLERFERLERLERDPFLVSIRGSQCRELKKGNKEILTGTSVPLDTCLLMGDPVQAECNE
jgi:hypothetical protein